MKLLKNKEVLKTLIIQLVIGSVASIIGFIFDEAAGILAVLLSLVFIIVYYIATYRRYKQIASLSEDINKLLHGDNTISFEDYTEGELSVLQSEIHKMTIRLREQQQRLIDDKVYLADSIADISHQIRTPLTSINLLVQLLSKPDLSEDKKRQHILELNRMLSRIDSLITALLKISKLDAKTVQFKPQNVSLEELINKSCEPLLVPFELRGQELKISAEGGFYGDLSWTCEAVGNIVKNCMEHTPEGGKVEITALENPIFSEIVIKDNGTGIDKDDLPHIFERFYKGKNSSGNSFGVGLALARMIITGQSGTIKAENRKDKGAKFTIRFYKGTV
ncbi:MAG: HAMP domain-containing histidine kinase [Clostridia bacterium]|nr:HAMP domain-containing histidine kinase [Clostridia bacterium]